MGHYLLFCCCTSNENSSLKTQKKLWICLILSKNLCLKYRFFVLFRRALNKLQLGLKTYRGLPSGSLIFSSSLSNLPEKHVMSEWFCRFFSMSLSKFTQTSCTFQARGVPAEKPAQLAMYLPRKPRSSRRTCRETRAARVAHLARNPRTRKPSVRVHTKRARIPRNSIRALVCLDGGEGRC